MRMNACKRSLSSKTYFIYECVNGISNVANTAIEKDIEQPTMHTKLMYLKQVKSLGNVF